MTTTTADGDYTRSRESTDDPCHAGGGVRGCVRYRVFFVGSLIKKRRKRMRKKKHKKMLRRTRHQRNK